MKSKVLINKIYFFDIHTNINNNLSRWSRIFYGTTDENSENNIEDGNSTTTLDNSMPVDRGLFSWFLTIIQLR